MRGTARQPVAAILILAVAGCSGASDATRGGDASPTPSPSPSASDRPEFVSERDLTGLVTEEDMPEGLEMAVYESIWSVPVYAGERLDGSWYTSSDPQECSELMAATVLLREDDFGSSSTDTVTFLFDVGGPGAAETEPSIMYLARIFRSADEAASYLEEVRHLAEACHDGFSITYLDGSSWEQSAVNAYHDSSGYPKGVGFLELVYDSEGYAPWTQLLIQYENAIISAVDIQTDTSAFVTPQDLHTFLRLVMYRLVGGD